MYKVIPKINQICEVSSKTSRSHNQSREVKFLTSQRSKKSQILTKFTIIPALVIALVGIIAISSTHISSAHAESLDFSVKVATSLSIAVSSSNISLNLNPANHPFDTQNLDVAVGTNNTHGYKLYINADSTNLSRNNSDSAYDEDNIPVIETVPDNGTTGYDESTFPANKWGYNMNTITDTSNYFPFASGTLVSSSPTAIDKNTTTISFAAKADYTKPAGQYELTLDFKALPIITTTYMQNLDPAVCTSDPTVAIDQRDEKAYTIRRLPDGNCWMVENLRFTGSSSDSDGTMTLSSSTSNVSSTYTDASPLTLNYYELDGPESSSADGHCYGTYDKETSTGAGNGYNYACLHYGSNDYTNGDTVWYNYATITAGTLTGESNFTSSAYDICPAGWRLPTSAEQSAITSYFAEYEPIMGGGYNGGVLDRASVHGYYWSSDPYNTSLRYIMGSNSTNIYAYNYYRRSNGVYARCIRKNESSTIADAAYMQDVTIDMVANTAEGTTVTLKDKRDSQEYSIAKINGNLWMTDNLKLGYNETNPSPYTITLDSTTSNISKVFTESSPLILEVYNIVSEGEIGEVCYGTYDVKTEIGEGDGYTTPCIHSGTISADNAVYSDTDLETVWYNYSLATAGTITGLSNQDDANYDICPAGWRMPSQTELSGLMGLSDDTIFNPVHGGRYYEGIIWSHEIGYWWSSTSYNAARRYRLGHRSTFGIDGSSRGTGFYIRCVKSA